MNLKKEFESLRVKMSAKKPNKSKWIEALMSYVDGEDVKMSFKYNPQPYSSIENIKNSTLTNNKNLSQEDILLMDWYLVNLQIVAKRTQNPHYTTIIKAVQTVRPE